MFLFCRCGEVFCAKCVAYQRRLNRLAHFDLDGDLEKVIFKFSAGINAQSSLGVNILILYWL